MLVALGVAAVSIALLLALLALPVEVAFHVEGRNAFAGELEVRAMFGLLHVRTRIPADSSRAPRTKRTKHASKQRTSEAHAGWPDVIAALKQADFRGRLLRFVRDVFAAVDIRSLDVRLRLGLGDPADTGRLWGLVAPLVWLVPKPRNALVRIEPDFDEAVLALLAQGRVVLVPLRFIALAIGFALAPVSVRTWRALRRDRVLA